jgi:hypothetical protein
LTTSGLVKRMLVLKGLAESLALQNAKSVLL